MRNALFTVVLCFLFFQTAYVEETSPSPENFHAEKMGQPMRYGPYGCANFVPVYRLWLDFENATFTRIDELCYAGDLFYSGMRGELEWRDDKAFFIATEKGAADYDDGADEIIWDETRYQAKGYFVAVTVDDTVHFDEYSEYGSYVEQW